MMDLVSTLKAKLRSRKLQVENSNILQVPIVQFVIAQCDAGAIDDGRRNAIYSISPINT